MHVEQAQSSISLIRRAAIALVLLSALGMGLYLQQTYQAGREEVARNLAIQSAFAASHAQTFLDRIGDGMVLMGREFVDNPGYSRHTIRQHLHEFLDIYPEVSALVLFDGEGQRFLHTAVAPDQPLPQLCLPPGAFSGKAGRSRYGVGPTGTSTVTGVWRVPLRAPIRDAQGVVRLVIQADIPISEHEALWQGILLPPHAVIGILHGDGMHMARSPLRDAQSLFSTPEQGPLVEAMRRDGGASQGAFEGRAGADSSSMFGAYTRMERHALVAYVAMPRAVFWLKWLRHHGYVLPLFLGYLLFLVVGARLMIRHQRRHIDALLEQARRDPLTGLPNRFAAGEWLQQELAHARRKSSRVAVLVLDLDGFKDVNDSLGHGLGDQLLRMVARRLADGVLEADFLARLGGDEFMMAVSDVDVDALADQAGRIVELLSAPFVVDGHTLSVGVSIGIGLFPEDGDGMDVVLRHADAAMYEAKRKGRNTFEFFDPALEQAVHRRLRLQQDMQRALANGEFEVYYQPLVEMRSGRIVGAEALVRWNDPERGLRGPAEFIPHSESTGLILPLGQWVLRAACVQAVRWAGQGWPLKMSVNLSARQFRDPELPAQVGAILRDTGMVAESLQLEITESTAMEHPAQALEAMSALKALGLRLAIDDFGTGYSSLSYLKCIPADLIKVDQSFVREMLADASDRAIVEAMIGLSATLGRSSLAEGIETAEVFDALRAYGCHYGQGDLFAPPLPADRFEALLRQGIRYGAGEAGG